MRCSRLTFYFVGIATAVAFSVSYPGGPCTPGSGIIILAILPFITFILFTINLILYLFDKQEYRPSVTIHLCALAIYLIVFRVLRNN